MGLGLLPDENVQGKHGDLEMSRREGLVYSYLCRGKSFQKKTSPLKPALIAWTKTGRLSIFIVMIGRPIGERNPALGLIALAVRSRYSAMSVWRASSLPPPKHPSGCFGETEAIPWL